VGNVRVVRATPKSKDGSGLLSGFEGRGSGSAGREREREREERRKRFGDQ